MPRNEVSERLQRIDVLLKQLSSGQLTPNEAQTMTNILENRRRAIETEEHEARLRALEAQHAAG